MKLLKTIIDFFKGLFTRKAPEENTKVRTFSPTKRKAAPKRLSNAEKLFDWLASKGYTKYVHPRGIYADANRGKGDVESSHYRLMIMNQRKLREEYEEKGKKIERSETRNRYGMKVITN